MQVDPRYFEDAVRDIARELWPSGFNQGAMVHDSREHDGMFVTEENVHLIEATVSRRMDKARDDASKMARAAADLRRKSEFRTKTIICWFITSDEPTADQRGAIDTIAKNKNVHINALSFATFQSKLINVKDYLSLRQKYRFGSMEDTDLKTKAFRFVEQDIMSDTGEKVGVQRLAEQLLDGDRFVLLGDFGGGKSTTLREIFRKLLGKQKGSILFPVHINLRDHFGQTNAAEALIRHATLIGFEPSNHLVRAWRAGYTPLLLDGFDEIAVAGWSGQAAQLKKLRKDSMQLVRSFVRDTPSTCGIVIAGRSSYFDSRNEMHDALGLEPKSYKVLTLRDFTDEQIETYLRHKDWDRSDIPMWLPARPLLLGYLARRDVLNEVVGSDLTPAAGWNMLLGKICEREAKIEFGVDGESIRRLIERLSSSVRRGMDDLGPLHPDEIQEAFKQVCHFSPDEKSMILINRLPGLGVPNAEDGARSFIDRSLTDAAQAGDVFRFVEHPYDRELSGAEDWTTSLRKLGAQVAALRCRNAGFAEGKLKSAFESSVKHKTAALSADIVLVMQDLEYGYSGDRAFVKDVLHPQADYDDSTVDLSAVTFQGCIFKQFELAMGVNIDTLPRFDRCHFGVVHGRISSLDMPEAAFTNCTYEEFSNPGETSAAILDLDLPLGQRVLLVVLRKLYVQAGSGRKESALYRGLDQRARALVPEILRLLTSANFVVETRSGGSTIWLPVRSQYVRAQQILTSPNLSKDDILIEAARLSA